MTQADFAIVDAWVFDLDNTLYPPKAGLFAQIEPRIVAYMSDALGIGETEADRLRKKYWRRHGTTLAGLMAEHGVDPVPFLHEVHQIDFTVLSPAPDLATAIAALPGRKIVYTNGCEPYARNVLAARGLGEVFDAVYGMEHAGFRPKPEQSAFEAIFALDGLPAERGAMFEDDARNLAAPHAMGMRTVHVAPEAEYHDHIHFHTSNLTGFLQNLLAI